MGRYRRSRENFDRVPEKHVEAARRQVVKASRDGDGWETEAEVYEELFYQIPRASDQGPGQKCLYRETG